MDAKQTGKTRYIGFTGRVSPAIKTRPINVMDAHFRSFPHDVVPVPMERKAPLLGMKPMGRGVILKSNAVTPRRSRQCGLSSLWIKPALLNCFHKRRKRRSKENILSIPPAGIRNGWVRKSTRHGLALEARVRRCRAAPGPIDVHVSPAHDGHQRSPPDRRV